MQALRAAGAEVALLPRGPAGLDLAELLARLAARECNEVLVEAGPTLAGAFLAAGLVDELVCYVAATLLGDGARPMLRLPLLERLDARPRLRIIDTRTVGGDLRLTLRPQ